MGNEPNSVLKRGGDRAGNALVLVMIFAGIMAILVPLFTRMIHDSTVNSAESKVSMTRKLLASNLLSFAVSPGSLLQSTYQASWSTSPAPSGTALFNNCLWTCVNGPTSTFTTASTASSCDQQMAAMSPAVTYLGSTSERCQSYDASNSYAPVWYDFSLVLANDSTVQAGRISDSAAAAYQRYTLDGVPCLGTAPDSMCPLIARSQFHPLCPGDPLVSSVPSVPPTSPAYSTQLYPIRVTCRQAATIQTRITLSWNPAVPQPTAGRGQLAYVKPLDTAYDALGNALTLDKLPQTPVWYGALAGTDGILGASGRKPYPVQIAARNNTTFANYALMSDGTVRAWGDNSLGQLGVSTASLASSTVPVQVPSLTNVEAISGAGSGACAVQSDGTIQCWGANNYGQLGLGNTSTTTGPQAVTVLGSTKAEKNSAGKFQISGDTYQVCARVTGGKIRCWGTTSAGNFANPLGGPASSYAAAVASPDLTNVEQISARGSATCLVTTTGQVWCTGINDKGQLGQGTTANVSGNFVQVPAASFAGTPAEVQLGGWSTCVRLTSGQVQCWGSGSVGAWGDGTSSATNRLAPGSTVSNLTDATSLSVGLGSSGSRVCAVKSDSTVVCWGYGGDGLLGNGTTTDQSTPTLVLQDSLTGTALTGVSQTDSTGMARPTGTVCFLLSTGNVRCVSKSYASYVQYPGNGSTSVTVFPQTSAGPWQ